jgi:hypothetical protein
MFKSWIARVRGRWESGPAAIQLLAWDTLGLEKAPGEHGGDRATKRHCANPMQNLTETATQNSTKSTPNPDIQLPKAANNKT